jgi:hypothetical protein
MKRSLDFMVTATSALAQALTALSNFEREDGTLSLSSAMSRCAQC